MTQKVQLKRSAVPGKLPTTGDIDLGEVAINTYDGRFFFKQSDGNTSNIIELVPSSPSGTISTAKLGTGTADSTTYLRGDGTWQLAGSTITDDTTTNSEYYPALAVVTSGAMTTAKISSTKLTYNPSTGTVTSVDFNSTSDITLKENIEPLTNSIEILQQINPVSFTWKDSGALSFGVIAQEIEEVLPNVVDTNSNGIKSVSYLQLIALLIDAVKQQQNEINSLKNSLV